MDHETRSAIAVVVGSWLLWQVVGPQRRQRVIGALEEWAASETARKKRQEAPRSEVLSPPSRGPISGAGAAGGGPSSDLHGSLADLVEWAAIHDSPPGSAAKSGAIGQPIMDLGLESLLVRPSLLEADHRWRDVVRLPAVVLIVGKRGSGKSALGYRLLELFRHGLAPYVVAAPRHVRGLLPEWVGLVPSLDELPPRAIALVDEAYLRFHSRRSMADESTAMSQVLNLSRQREQTLVFVSQEARQLDRNVSSSASVVVFKDLGMLQLEFERPELRKIAGQARQVFAASEGDRRRLSFVYSPDADFLGPLENELPTFWKPRLSRIFAAEETPATPRRAVTSTPEERGRGARELRGQGFSYSEIGKALGVSRATVVNYVKGYPDRR